MSYLDESRHSSIDEDCYGNDLNGIAADGDESNTCQNFSSEEVFKRFQEYVNIVKKNESSHSSPEGAHGPKNDFFYDHSNSSDDASEYNQEYSSREVQSLLSSNQKYREQCEELRAKNEQLQRNIEIEEDNSENLKKQIGILEKELKCCLQDRNYLENEMEQMQTDLATTLNDKIKAENCNKRIKKEEEELRQTIQNQTDQIESLSGDICTLNTANKNLFEENASLKDRCESLEIDVEMKGRDLEQKMQIYQVLREQVEEYNTNVQNLKEEKELLLNQLQEAQIESSIYQGTSSYKSSDAGTYYGQPMQMRGVNSLQSEIAEAELVVYGKQYSSFYSSPSSTPACSSLNLSNTSQKSPKTVESTTQTMPLSGGDGWSPQIEERDPSNKVEKEDEHEVSELPGRLDRFEKELQQMTNVTSQHTARENYLNGQLGMKQNKIRELLATNQKHAIEITLLSDIIQKLGRSKLEAWFDEADELHTADTDDEKRINSLDSQTSLNDKFSPLIEALSLESLALSSRSRIKYFQFEEIPKSIQRFICNADDVMNQSKISLEGRLQILNKTKGFLEEAIMKKLEAVKDLLKDFHSFSSLETLHQDKEQVQQTVTLYRDVNDLLTSAADLMRRYGACYQPIGALQTEQRYTTVVEVFVRHFEKLSLKPLTTNAIEFKTNQAEDSFGDIERFRQTWSSVSSPDPSVEDIDPSLFNMITKPRNESKFMKVLAESKHTSGLFQSLICFNHKLQDYLPYVSRTTMLVATFLACTCYSITPMEYRGEPPIF